MYLQGALRYLQRYYVSENLRSIGSWTLHVLFREQDTFSIVDTNLEGGGEDSYVTKSVES
jgi:hypothetical protein